MYSYIALVLEFFFYWIFKMRFDSKYITALPILQYENVNKLISIFIFLFQGKVYNWLVKYDRESIARVIYSYIRLSAGGCKKYLDIKCPIYAAPLQPSASRRYLGTNLWTELNWTTATRALRRTVKKGSWRSSWI